MAKKKTVVKNFNFSDANVEYKAHADILKFVKTHKKISWNQIAKYAGVSRAHISRVKDGKKGLRFWRYVKLARGLDIPLPLLFSNVAKTQPTPKKLQKGDTLVHSIWQQSAEMSEHEPEINEVDIPQ